MAGRFVLRFGRRPPVEEPAADADAPPPDVMPPPPPRPVPPHRERRELARRREIEIRDIGGLALEMARRDDWRYPLLRSRTAEVLAIEERLHELDALVAAAEIAARGVGAVECECGAPVLRGSHFCANCGRPAPDTAPVVTCSHCGQPLAAETNFCPVCGNAVAAEAFEGEIEDTFVAPVPDEEPPPGEQR
jgi:Double zinc ribbon